MTAEQEIKAEILRDAIARGDYQYGGGITAGNIEDLYDQFVETDYHWDYESEFRCSGENTGLPAPYSRHYEGDAVARRLSNGKWVGWTYWHGGGKHGEPEAIDWIEDAYFLNVTEEEKLVTVRTFTRAEKVEGGDD